MRYARPIVRVLTGVWGLFLLAYAVFMWRGIGPEKHVIASVPCGLFCLGYSICSRRNA